VTPALAYRAQYRQEPLLPEATGTAHRTTPSLLGFGLLEAVPDVEIVALAAANHRDRDGISGRPNRTADGRLGRFGRKAQIATLSEFTAGAFVNEMGITSPTQPQEQTIRGQKPVSRGRRSSPRPGYRRTSWMPRRLRAFLRPAGAAAAHDGGAAGPPHLLAIGCAECTSGARHRVQPRAGVGSQRFHPYTDSVLLHDMGPDLGDICLARQGLRSSALSR